MPINDNGEPFVAATVAFLDKKPTETPAEVNKKLFHILKALNAVPFAAIVKPFPGYGKLRQAKYDQMRIIARQTRSLTGAPEPVDLNDRDIVWGHAMGQAIVHAVLSNIFTTSINDVKVLLDQKSMKTSQRSLFTKMVTSNMGMIIREIMKTISNEWKNHVRFTDKTTSINWSDESKEFESEYGLKLAHRLSRKLYRSQIGQPTDMEAIFKNAGFEDAVMDITGLIARLD